MNSVFITGIPTAGKTYLAKKIADQLGISWLKMDDTKEIMLKNPKLEPWVNFYWHQFEKDYFEHTSPKQQWQNLVDQSEAFWSVQKKAIKHLLAAKRPVIFEGVNLLPHLMKQLPIKGVVLLGISEEEVLNRLKRAPRWGRTPTLQKLEAHSFFNIERPRYAAEAKKFGYPVFSDPQEAEVELIKLIQD